MYKKFSAWSDNNFPTWQREGNELPKKRKLQAKFLGRARHNKISPVESDVTGHTKNWTKHELHIFSFSLCMFFLSFVSLGRTMEWVDLFSTFLWLVRGLFYNFIFTCDVLLVIWRNNSLGLVKLALDDGNIV